MFFSESSLTIPMKHGGRAKYFDVMCILESMYHV